MLLPHGDAGVVVRSDNGIVFADTSIALLSSYGLTQEFVHPHTQAKDEAK